MPDNPLTFFTFCDLPGSYGLMPIPIRWMNALKRCGHTVHRVGSDAVPVTLPDDVNVVLVHHNTAMTKPETLSAWQEQLSRRKPPGIMVQIVVDLIMRDAANPLEAQWHYRHWHDVWPLLDMVFVKERPVIAELTKWGIPTTYMDQGVVKDYIPPGVTPWRPDWACDFAFCGNARETKRFELLHALEHVGSVVIFCAPEDRDGWDKAGFDVRGPCFGQDLAVLAQSAKVIVGDNLRNDVEGYWSNRLWLTLGAKACHLTAWVPGMDKVLQNAHHALLFRDVDDAVGLSHQLLGVDALRRNIAEVGHQHALSKHTTEHRCEEVLVPAVRDALTKKQRGESTPKRLPLPPVAVTPQTPMPIRTPPSTKKHVLLIAPWTAQGLTTMAVYHGRLLESLGCKVTYHAWHGQFDGPGWPEDVRVNIANPEGLDLDDIDVAIWYELTDAAQVARCKEHGITTIWIPMWEFVEKPNPDKDVQFDLVVCPTKHTFEVMRKKQWPAYAKKLCPWSCNFRMPPRHHTSREPVFFHCVRGITGDRRNTTALLQAWRQFKRARGTGTLIVKSIAPLRQFVDDFAPLPDLKVIEGCIPREQLMQLYEQADCFLYPTKCEGVGLVLLEALMAGLPIVTTDAPPMNEWLQRNNGLALAVSSIQAVNYGTYAYVEPATITKALHLLTPERIDIMKNNVLSGLAARDERFRDFWADTIGSIQKSRVAARERIPSTRRHYNKPHLVVAAIQWGRGRGGGELSLMMLADKARQMGYEVSCLYETCVGPMPDWVPATQANSLMLEEKLKASRPDVVLADVNRLTVVRRAATACGVPSVFYVQFWGPLLKYGKSGDIARLDDWLQEQSPTIPPEALSPAFPEMGKATALVANSEYTADVLRMLVKRKPDAVAEPYVEPIARLDGPHDCIMLPSCQRLKGVHELMFLAKRRPHQQFLMLTGDKSVGDTAIEEVVAIPNIEAVPQWVMDMAPIYARTKVMLLATRTCESYSRTTAEARSLGIPVLLLKAGNLARHLTPVAGQDGSGPDSWIRCTAGALVERDAGEDAWDNALTYCEGLRLKADPTVLGDQRHKLVEVLDAHRLFGDVAILRPARAPGVTSAIDNIAGTLGCTSFQWDTPAEKLSGFAAVILPGQWRQDLANLSGHVVIWWCSHLAQMDTSRHEAEALAKIIASLEKHPRIHIAFTCEADAKLWGDRGVRSWWLPPILEDVEMNVEKRPGLNIFIPGPYRERKNVFTGLGAAAMCDAEVHVTALARESRGMAELAEAMGVKLHIHNCPTTVSVLELAGSCQVALAISTAETFSYGAAECVQAGTPTVFWAGIPALATGPEQLCVQDPTNVAEVASAALWAAQEGQHVLDEQRRALKRTIVPHVAAARKTLLDILAGGKPC